MATGPFSTPIAEIIVSIIDWLQKGLRAADTWLIDHCINRNRHFGTMLFLRAFSRIPEARNTSTSVSIVELRKYIQDMGITSYQSGRQQGYHAVLYSGAPSHSYGGSKTCKSIHVLGYILPSFLLKHLFEAFPTLGYAVLSLSS